jgi:hypothetical protein
MPLARTPRVDTAGAAGHERGIPAYGFSMLRRGAGDKEDSWDDCEPAD